MTEIQPAGYVLLAVGAIGVLFWLVALGCYVWVVIKMFQNQQTGLGIASLVLAPCVGIGGLIAFVMGWMKAGEWKIKGVMITWTGTGVIAFCFGGAAGVAVNMMGEKASSTFTTVGASIGSRR
jgi:hypothetical protein